jgi:hypothetical protein
MSIAQLTTAAEMAREFFRIDPDAALTPTVERCVADLAAFLTTYAAQVRRDALEECAKIAEEFPAPATKYNCCQSIADKIRGRRKPPDEHTRMFMEAANFEGRSLPPGSPSSQTDTGDNT